MSSISTIVRRTSAFAVAATLASGALVAATVTPAAATCEYPWYCETVRVDTPVYAEPDRNSRVFYTARAGDAVEVNINSCHYGFIWGADVNQGRATGYFVNADLNFSPCYLFNRSGKPSGS